MRLLDDQEAGVAVAAAVVETPKRKYRFKARVAINWMLYYFGTFDTREEAKAREDEARAEYARTGEVSGYISVRRIGEVQEPEVGDWHLWYWSHFRAGRELTPAESLMAAVAYDAILCLKSDDPKTRNEAIEWVTSDEVFLHSFISICDVFGIDIEAAREALLGE